MTLKHVCVSDVFLGALLRAAYGKTKSHKSCSFLLLRAKLQKLTLKSFSLLFVGLWLVGGRFQVSLVVL